MSDENLSDKRIKAQVDKVYKVGEGMKNLSFWQKNKRKIIVPSVLLGIGAIALYFPGEKVKELVLNYGIDKGKKQAEETYKPQIKVKDTALRYNKEALDKLSLSFGAKGDTLKTAQDSLKTAKEDVIKEKKAKETAIAQARLTERETILTAVNTYADSIPGFNLLIDYVVDGRSFEAKKLPWKVSLEDSGFRVYMLNPTKNVEDCLKIKELGEKGLVPRNSIEAFFKSKFDTYVGDIVGEVVRAKYSVNANDGKLYGVKLQNGKVIGLDELARQDVKYTGPTREEIRKKMPKINIPDGWRQMQSYQKK